MVPSVLIVDDEPALRHLLRLLIERDGRLNVCGVARDGREALALIEPHQPDVILLDLQMPGMGGLEVLERLDGRPRPAPVVFTASVGELTRARALELGAVEVLAKGQDGFSKVLDALLTASAQRIEGRRPVDRCRERRRGR